MKFSFPLKTLYRLLGILGTICGVLFLQLNQLSNKLSNTDTPEEALNSQFVLEEQALKSSLRLLKQVPNFGYENVVSNLIYLNFLQYFGNNQARSNVGHTASSLFFEAIVERDPLFTHTYLFLSTSVSLYAGRAEVAVALMDKGLQAMAPSLPPDSYYVWRNKAIDELLFLGDGEAARQSHLKAAEWATLSSDPEGEIVAERSLNTANFLAQDVNSKPAQIASWAQVLVRADDDETRQIAVSNIEALGGTIVVNQNGQVTVNYKVDDDTTAPTSPQAEDQN